MYVPTAQPALNRRTRRAPGRTPGTRLPTPAEIDDLLTDTDWASFSDRVEDFHDHVHVWVGADMSDIATAAFDPIFFAHHCQIDRLWYLWQVRHGNGSFPAELLAEPLVPFGKTSGDVLNIQALRYEYAASAAPVLPAGGAPLSSVTYLGPSRTTRVLRCHWETFRSTTSITSGRPPW